MLCNRKLSFGKEFKWTQEDLFVKKGLRWEMIFDAIDNLPLAIKERGVNKILRRDYEGYVGVEESSSFMSSGVVPINILVKGNFGGRRYFKWENGVWFEEKDNEWEKRGWNDFEGLKKIYSESNDLLFNDEVFYRVGIFGAVVWDYSIGEDDEFISLEDINAGEDFYELLDIFRGDSGKISDNRDFEVFQEWFSLEGGKIMENQEFLDKGLKNFENLLPLESSGEFDGKPYSLFLVRDSEGEGVFYLETSIEKYGLKGEGLKLVKDSGENGWGVAESSSTLFRTSEEFEEDVRLHKIRKFLEGRC